MPGGVEFRDTAHLEKLNLHVAAAACAAHSNLWTASYSATLAAQAGPTDNAKVDHAYTVERTCLASKRPHTVSAQPFCPVRRD